jgi:hypothetical protein
VASRVIGWLEILGYIGSWREIEKRTSVPNGSPWERMKLLGSHMTTERTNRRQEQEYMMTLKRGSFFWSTKTMEKVCVAQRTNLSSLHIGSLSMHYTVLYLRRKFYS